MHLKVAEFAILDVLQQIPFVNANLFIFFINHRGDLHGGRSLDRRIILAIFQNQRQNGNDRQDHEGWS